MTAAEGGSSQTGAAPPPDEQPRLTSAEVAAAAGVGERDVRRLWRALGLPDVGAEAGYSEQDLAVVTGLFGGLASAGLGAPAAVRLARAIGQNVTRMSEWQVAAVAPRSASGARQGDGGPALQDPSGGPGPDGAGDAAGGPSGDTAEGPGGGPVGPAVEQVVDTVSPALEELLVHAWRRHLAAALARFEVDPGRGPGATRGAGPGAGAGGGAGGGSSSGVGGDSISVTVGFADLVAFSALSNDLGSERLGELVEIFEARCADVIAAFDGRMVKTLGDSVLFFADAADDAMSIAHGIVEVIGSDGRLPDVSLGLASGEVITRLGDLFGPPVNLAARLTALARRNRVLTDEETVARLSAATPGRYDVRRLTARPLRGFGLVEPIAVRRNPGR